MRQANGGDPPDSAFANQFLGQIFESWLVEQQLPGGRTLPPRDAERVRSVLLDELSTLDPTTGTRNFELWRAPFELIAIVNRADLAAADGSDGGELRFVFKLAHPDRGDQKLTLIIEYKVPLAEWNKTTWAHLWHRLSSEEIGSDEYLRRLETLTNHVTKWPSTEFAFPRRVSQIRTNELALASDLDQRWEMREFRPNSAGLLVPALPFNAPDQDLNGSEAFARFVACTPELSLTNAETNGAAREVVIPDAFTDCSDPSFQESLLGTRAFAGEPWTITGATAVEVDNFGMLTCNGCHNDHNAPKVFDFYHVSPELPEAASVNELLTGVARLSLFLTDERPEADGATVAVSELQRRKELQLERLMTECTHELCNPGAQCSVDDDCPAFPAYLHCVDKRCKRPAHCSNWTQDVADGEGGLDCGGDCTSCYFGRQCIDSSDCWTGASCQQGVCDQ